MSPKPDILLFYKNLIEVGGAERLVLKEYQEMKNLGFQVRILTFSYSQKACLNMDIPKEDILVFNSKIPFGAILKLAKYLKRNASGKLLCSSGHIDVYLASLLSKTIYSMHIHHPSFMSFNELDKFSWFLKPHYKTLLTSNYGASVYIPKMKEDLTALAYAKLNIRAFFSRKSIQAAKHIFVLSDYAKREKKLLFNVTADVICGAIDDTIFNTKLQSPFGSIYENTYKILAIQRLDKNKRLDQLIHAFSLIISEHPSAILFIGGRGSELETLQALTRKLKIENKVIFLGFIPEEQLFDYYAHVDLFVCLDWADYTITAFESLAVGTKVLLSNEVNYPQELMDTGWITLTQPDADSTAQNINVAINARPKTSGEQLREILQEYTWTRYVKKITKRLMES